MINLIKLLDKKKIFSISNIGINLLEATLLKISNIF
jgi:hypothetical protein